MKRVAAGALAIGALVMAACGSDGAATPASSTPASSTTRSTTIGASSSTAAAPPPKTTTSSSSTVAVVTSPATTAATTTAPTVAPTPPATTTIAATTTVAAPSPAQCVERLPTVQRVAQLVWPAVYGNELVKRTATFAEWQVGGAVLMTWPDAATTAQLQALKSAGTVPLLIGTDEEGGNVQRMARLGIIPAAATVASTMTPAAAEQMIAAHAAVVKAAGVDIVFAPVVDVSPRVGVGPIGNRAFSSDPKVVTEFAQAYVQGWESAGILPVLKHFPGHGSASGDTHKLNATTPALDVLRARDLLPYAALAGTGVGVMVGHLDVPGLTDVDGVPASLSPAAITGLLRENYGYADALVFTDALGMKAITNEFGTPEAAERAIAAGADVVIFTSTDDTPLIIDRLADAVDTGRIPAARVDEAVLHVLRGKGVDPCSVAPAG